MTETKSLGCTLSLVCLGLSLFGCGEKGAATFLELGGVLRDAQANGNGEIDRLTLRVATSSDVTLFEVPLDSRQTEVDLPAGALLLEVLGERVDGTAAVPTYFGDLRVFITPGATASLTVPVFPAGLLDVEVLVDPEDVPDRAVVRFTAQAPRPEQSDVYLAEFLAGRIRRVLPAGDYTYRALASFDNGREFEAVGDEFEPITIEQGIVLSEIIDLRD